MICRAALVLVSLLATLGTNAEKLHDYVGVEKCRTCHEKELMGNQVKAWAEGPHRKAYETLTSERSQQIARDRGIQTPAHQSDACLRCHVTAHDVSPVRIANPVELVDGVQCESCHGPGRDYRKKKIMSDREVAMKKGLWDASADGAICSNCHNPESPTYDPERYVRADGTKVGFDFEIAKSRVPHAIPEHVKGRFMELEDAEKAEERAASGK
jgi:hypothetical protein